MKLMINPNVVNEGNQMEILDTTKFMKTHDEIDLIVRCNNCGQATEYGKTRMCSGFVGCDNKIIVHGKEVECYFDDLMPRVRYAHDNQTEEYKTKKIYRWRDGADGGLD